MASNSSVNLDITNNVDGFTVAGGGTKRGITVTGGNVELEGGGGFTYTFPGASGLLALASEIPIVISNLDDVNTVGVSTGDLLRFSGAAWVPFSGIESFIVMLSDMTSDLSVGTSVVSFRMPAAFSITEVRAFVHVASTGSTIIVDINVAGVSILSTKLSIDATEETSSTAAVPAVISSASVSSDAKLTFDIDQVGSTTTGKGLGVLIRGTRT